MSSIAMYVWMGTILAGLLLFGIWIMEYDREFQTAAETHLPVPVISAHALLGIGGLMLWIGYLLVDQDRLAYGAIAVLGTVALLGLIMAARWIAVYRAYANPGRAGSATTATVPPERKFPVPLVVTHGLLAVTTIGLVVITVFYSSS
ncbi:MAG TPA: hypothetical protein VH589_06555 [Trebonia sp.]|jgi:hypothetical protein